jgi:hypothetical protein
MGAKLCTTSVRLNGYVGFCDGRRAECVAPTSRRAQEKMAKELGAKNVYDVTVVLAERPVGTPVIHRPWF